MLSAGFGTEPTEGYEDTFLKSLRETRRQTNDRIKSYRVPGSFDQILGDSYLAYGDLKFAAYHLGNPRGLGRALPEMPAERAPLASISTCRPRPRRRQAKPRPLSSAQSSPLRRVP